jgi:hypothetical protein
MTGEDPFKSINSINVTAEQRGLLMGWLWLLVMVLMFCQFHLSLFTSF